MVWLSTEADDQSSLHCITVSTDVVSENTGRSIPLKVRDE